MDLGEEFLPVGRLLEYYMVLSDYQCICWGYHLHAKLCHELDPSQSPRTLLMSFSHMHSYAP